MNKLRILETSLISTALLSIVILIATSFIMVVFPIAYFQSIAKINDEDIVGYSDKIADYCTVNFHTLDNQQYKELCKTFDMENFAGTANYGYVEHKLPHDIDPRNYALYFASEKLVNELPSLGYDFSNPRPKDYKEAYAPTNLKEVYEIGQTYEISCYEGVYQYKQKIKILGYCEHDYYDFFAGYTTSFLDNMSDKFLIYDEIPPYAKIESGLMMSNHKPEYYNNLGAKATTVRQMNIDIKTSEVLDIFLYWCICAIVLLIIVVMANYYFASDKLIKRSGTMYIYGGKRSTIIGMEVLKMLLLFLLAVAISTITIAVVIGETSYGEKDSYDTSTLVNWKTYFICVGISFAVYLVSILPGLIKLARFKPLKALSNNNVE